MKVSNEELLALCLSGKSQRQIAKELGMTQAQVCKRMNRPEFQERLSECRKQQLDNVLGSLMRSSMKAVETLTAILDDKNVFARYSAASRILALVQDYSVQRDLLTELEKLKEMQQNMSF